MLKNATLYIEKLTAAPLWNILSVVLFVIELAVIGLAIFELFRKNKKNHSIIFLAVAFLINASLYIIPYIYDLSLKEGSSAEVLDIMVCLSNTFKAFVGEWEAGTVKTFAEEVPFFRVTYVTGSIIAPVATVSAAAHIFSLTLLHNIRRWFMLHGKSCDIVLGMGDNALQYAKGGRAILIPDPAIDGDGINRLIERGYIVWSTAFSCELLSGRRLNFRTDYKIVCPGKTEENLEHINTFIAYYKSNEKKKKIHLFVELEGEKTGVIRREIIDKSCCGDSITPFCSDGLLAVKFAEEHPITEKIPESFIDWDGSIKRDFSINVVYLGFGGLNQEMYYRSVLNNQLVEWSGDTDDEGEYVLHPVNYHLVDMGINSNVWLIDGLKKELEKLEKDKDSYYPIPPTPYNINILDKAPDSEEPIGKINELTNSEKSFCYVIVDVGNSYKNIELGTRLRYFLGEKTNYHIYIRCDTAYIEDDEYITYLGDITDIFTHDVIVNDSMFEIARKINEVYEINKLSADDKKISKCVEDKLKVAEERWRTMDSFTRFSNFFAAMNLRLKLQLLGLDYVTARIQSDDRSDVMAVLTEFLELKDKHKEYNDYFLRNKRNAMLAQEKFRWNAYHLYKKVLPKKIDDIKKEKNAKTFGVGKKLLKHGCVTTYTGLDLLIKDLYVCNPGSSIDDIEYYKYDDQLLHSTIDVMKNLGYTIVKKK